MAQQSNSRKIAVATAALLHVAIGMVLFASARPRAGHAARNGTGEIVMMISFLPVGAAPAAQSRPPVGAAPAAQKSTASTAPVVVAISTPAASAGLATETSAAPLGIDAGTSMSSADVESYRARLQSHLAQYRRYPLDARREHVEGTVLIHFIIDRAGGVTSAWVDTSSGSGSLDREAIEAVARAQPLPLPPPGWPSLIDVTLPVAFGLG